MKSDRCYRLWVMLLQLVKLLAVSGSRWSMVKGLIDVPEVVDMQIEREMID